MLNRNEFRQLFTAIVSMEQYRINGRDRVDMRSVLELLATFCDEPITIQQLASDEPNTMVMRASIG